MALPDALFNATPLVKLMYSHFLFYIKVLRNFRELNNNKFTSLPNNLFDNTPLVQELYAREDLLTLYS